MDQEAELRRPFRLNRAIGSSNGYLIFTDTSGARHWYGSDAVTGSYTGLGPKSLAGAIAGLNEEQGARYLDPPYTIGSATIWPVMSKDRPTMNTARGSVRSADRPEHHPEIEVRHSLRIKRRLVVIFALAMPTGASIIRRAAWCR